MNSFSILLKNAQRVLQTIWRIDRPATAAIVGAAVLGAIIPFFRSGSLAILVDAISNSGEYGPLAREYFGYVVFVTLAIPVLWTQIQRLHGFLERRIVNRLQKHFDLAIIEKHATLDIAAQEDPERRDLFQRAYENGGSAPSNFSMHLPDVASSLLSVIIGALVLGRLAWWALPTLILITAPQLWAEIRYGNRNWRIWSGSTEHRRKFYSLRNHFATSESLTELKIMQGQNYLLGHIRDLLDKVWDKVIHAEFRGYTTRTFSQGVANIGSASIAAYFAYQAFSGEISVGTMTFLITIIANTQSDLAGFFASIGRLNEQNLRTADVFQLLDLKPNIIYPKNGLRLGSETPEIVFRNVGFTYPGTSKPVLKNISFTLKPGAKLAIIGINGAGKTTIIKLLCRLYDPSSGKILVDGKDLREIEIESWYGHLGILPQSYIHYDFTVAATIAMGRAELNIDQERVKLAAQHADADKFIQEYPNGYEEQLNRGFGGTEPSVGQWQKLALARIFYRDPNIWILDEPTASIDPESEAKIFDQIATLPKDRSAIFISHRFSTVRHADKIIVLADGQIAEQGTHPELLAKKGIYARLYHLQAKGYE